MKLCLAGTSSFKNYIDIENCDFLLESFYYFQEWQNNLIDKKFFLLDSGAFTFMNARKGITKKEIEDYNKKLGLFVREKKIKNYFNVDMDTVFGVSYTEYLRKQLEDIVGWACIPVFHKCMGLDGYEKLLEEYKYIAIGTMADYGKKYNILRELVKIAERKKCKVHGLGFTRLEELSKIGFYSVDSTSWTCGNRFGYIYRFNGETLEKIPAGKNRKVKTRQTIRHNFNEWCKFQKYLYLGGKN